MFALENSLFSQKNMSNWHFFKKSIIIQVNNGTVVSAADMQAFFGLARVPEQESDAQAWDSCAAVQDGS